MPPERAGSAGGGGESDGVFMKKARFCDTCWHGTHLGDEQPTCDKKHKPRFYVPQTLHDWTASNYGFKRRCDDYEEIPA